MLGLGIARVGLNSRRGAALDLNFLSGAVDGRISFSRPSTATRINAQGLLEVVASGAPRIDYDPITLAVRGLLVEEQRTNLLWNSSNFSAWGKFGATVTDNQAIAPDGTVTADKLTATLADSGVFQGATMTGGQAYTGSVWLRADVPCQLSIFLTETAGGSGNTSAVCNVTTAWQRFTVARTPGAGVTGLSFQIGGGNTFSTGEEVYAWGAQLEAGAFATSYIPTTSAQATRAADVATLALGAWFNAAEGTVVVDWELPVNSSDSNALSTFDAGGLPTMSMRMGQNGGRRIRAYAQIPGGSFEYAADAAVNANGTRGRSAFAWRGADDFAVVDGGGAVATDITGDISAQTFTTLNIGRNGATYANGWIRRLRYYRTRLSNAQLQGLTQ